MKDTGKAVQVPTPVQPWATIMAKTATALQVQRQPTQHYVFVYNHKRILHFNIFSSFVICTLPKIRLRILLYSRTGLDESFFSDQSAVSMTIFR